MRLQSYIQNCVFFITLLLPAVNADDHLGEFHLYTENSNPPFNYKKDGQPYGISVDLLLNMFALMGIDKKQDDIVMMPWMRAFRATIDHPNTILFTTVRLADREDLFKWVGPIDTTQTVLIARKDARAKITTKTDFMHYTYAAFRGSQEETTLLEMGVTTNQLLHVTSNISALKMLTRKRVDVWVSNAVIANWVLNNEGYEINSFEIAYGFKPQQSYFALSRNINDTVVAKFQKALDTLKEDGTYQAIYVKHIGNSMLASANLE